MPVTHNQANLKIRKRDIKSTSLRSQIPLRGDYCDGVLLSIVLSELQMDVKYVVIF